MNFLWNCYSAPPDLGEQAIRFLAYDGIGASNPERNSEWLQMK